MARWSAAAAAGWCLLAAVAVAAEKHDPFPLPRVYTCNGSSLPIAATLAATSIPKSPVLQKAIPKYIGFLTAFGPSASKGKAVTSLVFEVKNVASALYIGVSREYTITLDGEAITITAKTPYGALDALEILSQLVTNATLQCGVLHAADSGPSLVHREVALDTAHRYFPRDTIIDIIEGLSYAHINVLNLHIGNTGALRVATKEHDLTDPVKSVYAHRDIADIVDAGRDVGVLVIPSLEVPDFASGFAPLYGDKGTHFCANASTPSYAMNRLMDDPDNYTSDIVTDYVTELGTLFKRGEEPISVHLGGRINASDLKSSCLLKSSASLQKKVLSNFKKADVRLYDQALSVTEAVSEKNLGDQVLYAYSVSAADLHKDHQVPLMQIVDAYQLSLDEGIPTTRSLTGDSYGFSATLSTSFLCETEACTGKANPPPNALGWMNHRTQDDGFSDAMSSVIFPSILSQAGDAWSSVLANKGDLDRFAARLAARGLSTCAPGCACTTKSACGKPYQAAATPAKKFGFGLIIALVIALSVLCVVIYNVVQQRKQSDSYEPLP